MVQSGRAPLVIPARERARWTLARSAPLSAWLIVSSFTYLALLWGLAQLDVEAQDGGVPVDVPDSVAATDCSLDGAGRCC
ncbi:hypothetical protein E4U03_06605 [Rothia nasimurium]|uniref:Uncharacterized protein n=1 Tax=Rothia nasimurium TaxID=85336 RepID=A0A4Y9F3J9_9MICC|nr:hypothetical protein [Rothia nasimurium]MBF0808273.1 hypothetical protein [Rothia nasimurium]TFU22336.1 hypothetical protein E4U03_06605 [Rothia nasimurium]